jgi:hypothetical protein
MEERRKALAAYREMKRSQQMIVGEENEEEQARVA